MGRVLAMVIVLVLGLVACDPANERTPVDAAIPRDAPPSDGAPPDASRLDAGIDLGDGGAGRDDAAIDAGPLGPPIYPADQRHSPIALDVADGLRAIAMRGADRQDDVFAKIGDSITVSTAFLQCFATASVDLDGRALMPVIDHFRVGDAGGSDPFRRTSLAAGVGWSASAAIAGDPSPLERELAATRPRFAVLMYGTNDVGFVDYDAYTRNMTTIVDTLLAGGTIPILSSIPPRDDDASANARVPIFGHLVRALALSRGLPFVDFHRELLPLPDHGLAGDGVHPQSSPLGACVLTSAGLQEAANVRNLITLEALDRLRRVVVLGEDELDPGAPRLRGRGTAAAPFVIDSLPFAAHGDTRTMGERAIDRYDACSTADESGPELRFRFHLDAPARVTAIVASGAGADLDVHLVSAGGDGSACVARDNREVSADLAAGDWDVIADTFSSGGVERAGEVFVVVLAR